MDRPPAVEAAQMLIEARYPACAAAFLSGSVIRGDGTPTSDLDIVVIAHPTIPVGPSVPPNTAPPFRESLLFAGWPVEVFIHIPASITHYFAKDAARRQPTLPTMCVESVILRGENGQAEAIRAEAEALLAEGPPPFDEDELAMQRYLLTDLIDDLAGSADPAETLFIAVRLAAAISEFLLTTNGRWSGQNKWAMRALRRYDGVWADRLAAAMTATCQGEDVQALIALADEALAPVGGRLFDGFWQAGSFNS